MNPIHEDEHLLVLEKPSGLLSVPGRGPEKQDCLSKRVQDRYPEALIVHRLDQGFCFFPIRIHFPVSCDKF
jgi:tRNA pseudouridine32 synthase/23S rRNA pseudouridine746 synthase